ncbi:MAG: hypothetical protein QOK37_3865 [Thermoanaerobaculia bacterium]|jgi:hypothetical protein|nr:hypothetical protein [Thermoanaerobaculia bacterium]
MRSETALRRCVIAFLCVCIFPVVTLAARLQSDGAAAFRHYILESDVPLDADAAAELAAAGIDVQQPLATHRYLVRVRGDAKLVHDARIRSLRAYDAAHKIARSAYAETASGKAFATLRILFQPEVTFADAQAAIDAAGGTIVTPFPLSMSGAQRLTARVPSMMMTTLAADERVFGVYGPPLRPKSLNAVAALLSKVTPLYSAPYNLAGDGVVLSLFEPYGPPDVTHPEFGGRVISHFAAGRTADSHATHVAGTMVAAGLNARAKGMAPNAALHSFDAQPFAADGSFDMAALMQQKRTGPSAVGSVADNNSWDFALSWQDNVWYANEDGYGAYSALESEPYDNASRAAGAPLFVHAAGNDAQAGNPSLTAPWFPHKHAEDQDAAGNFPHSYCYSQNGSGTDCPAPTCSVGRIYCETTKHPTHGAATTVGLLASIKNNVAVGALMDDGFTIAGFSSQGPTTDGRVKPELVAKGWKQFSTMPNNSYTDGTNCACPGFGTSMSSPVVTGIAGLVAQQYRKTFGKTPSAPILKTLLIAGADDLGAPGPDYIFGFGLADAKASVDLIVADGGTGSRIRTGAIENGPDADISVALPAGQKFRAVLGWFDPEVLLVPDPSLEFDDPLANKTLVNDLDLVVIDPNGATVFPYNPSGAVLRAPNHTDTTEEVEVDSSVAGIYHVIVRGAIGDARSKSQDYVVAMSAGTALPPCADAYESNDTQTTAFGNLLSGRTISARICSAADVDYYTFTSTSASVTITTTDTPVRVTVTSAITSTVTATIAANDSATLNPLISVFLSPLPNAQFFVRVEPNGPVGATGAYTLTPSFSFSSTPRKRAARK